MVLEAGWQDHAVGPEETIAIGKKIASELKPGHVLALLGGLGAGKTHLTKGIALGLGCTSDVTSPTFSLAHEYGGGRLVLFHFDFYRMEQEQEVLRIGWDEYLDEEGIIVVEWPDKFTTLLPKNTVWLQLEASGEPEQNTRIIRCVERAYPES